MKTSIFRIPKPILIFILIGVILVFACYVVSQWYYSRWDTTLFSFEENAPAALIYGAGQLSRFSDSYIGADDPASRSPELVKRIEEFESLIKDHPLVHYRIDSTDALERQFKAAKGDGKTELAWEIIDRFDHAHDFMLALTKMYLHDQLPFEKGSTEHQFIGKMIGTYRRFVEEADDPFGAEAFAKLQQRIEQEERDPEWMRQYNDYQDTIKLAEQIQAELDEFNQQNPAITNQITDTPWAMGSAETNTASAVSPPPLSSSMFEGENDVNLSVDDTMRDDTLSYQERDKFPTDPSLQEQTSFSPQQFENVMTLIDQYGTEEGLRRLKQTDPELARQFEGKSSIGEPEAPNSEQ